MQNCSLSTRSSACTPILPILVAYLIHCSGPLPWSSCSHSSSHTISYMQPQ